MMHLVLGAPDPAAVRLIRLLAERGESVVALVRAGEEVRLPDAAKVMTGDAASIDFGLSGSVYKELSREVTQLFLADTAARSSGGVEKSRIVRQAAEVMEFVRAGGAARGVSYLSSLLVFGDTSRPVSESELSVGQSFADEYEESLAVAEKIVQGLRGVCPLSILRTAPIVGDEEKGEIVAGSPLAQLVSEMQSAGSDKRYVFSDLPTRWETVDRAANALLSLRPQTELQVVHLVDESPLTDQELTQWIAARVGVSVLGSPGATRPWTSWARPRCPGARALFGWDLQFSRRKAEATIFELLDRDERSTLERIMPRTSGNNV